MLRLTVIVWSALSAVFLFVHSSSADEPQEREIRELANKYVAMVRTDNPTPLDAIREMLAEDFIQSTSHGKVVQGRDENLRWYKKAVDEIQALFSRFDYRFEIQTVRTHPSSALVFGKITLFGELKDDGSKFERQIWETIVFEKADGTWRMVHEHSTRANAE